MKGERQRSPLIALDAAVVVRVKVGKARLLLERVLLHIEPGRVDVGAEDVESLLERLRADLEEQERLAVVRGIDLVAGDELCSLGDEAIECTVALLFCQRSCCRAALALGLVLADECLVSLAETQRLLALVLRRFLPCVRSFHGTSFRLMDAYKNCIHCATGTRSVALCTEKGRIPKDAALDMPGCGSLL